MMKKRDFFEQLNIIKTCQKYNLSLWQCPQFLFLIMGIIIIGVILGTYYFGTYYIPQIEVVLLIVFLTVVILFIIAFLVCHSFEKIAEANKLKSEFIRIISHQLRSPISNLKWALEFLMSGRAGKIERAQVEYFKILKENTQRMGSLISNLLTVSKIEAQGLEFKKKEFSLIELIKNVISEFSPFAKAFNTDVSFEFPENFPNIFSDPFKIKIIIENLLENAIKYSKGKGEVRIRLEKRGKNFYFEIEDKGIGISKEAQKYIFQKFFRAENTLRYQTKGSGLGLYICKEIVKQLGGRIGFRSKENKGSVFWFLLPIK